MRLVVVYGGTKADVICYWLRVYGVIRCNDGEALPEWVFFTEQQQQRSWRGISTAQGIQQGGHICARAAENTEKEHVSSLQVREIQREREKPTNYWRRNSCSSLCLFLPSFLRMCVKSIVDKSPFETITDDCPHLNNLCNVLEHILLHRMQGFKASHDIHIIPAAITVH